MLDYFLSETISRGIATAALDQPGDEVALMAEPNQIGNDEQWNRRVLMHHLRPQAESPKMGKNGENVGFSRSFCRFPKPVGVAVAFVAAFLAAPGTAELGPAGRP
ncbi:hypothetical protein [Bradyrhizobium sp. URHD0069]|uniref:hypothetical protein n=1 Tax=Bradyrhizobium sp. URHD0069 TaxID=1380355 RepID=UPI0012DC234A|nr:hypothetical protein [Bradyrhizobium sp. URHD0069]